MRENLVSIIMPAYNSEKFISDAIKSVVEQDYDIWELIICDDSSEDDTIRICKKWSNIDSRIMLVQNKYGKGAPGARNTSLDQASGQFIAFLDSDDLWHPNKLSLQLNYMAANNCAFSFSYYDVISENGETLYEYHGPKIANRKNMLFCNLIPCLTAIYDSSVIGKVYQPDFKKRNDYALWLKILNSGVVHEARCIPKITASYRRNQYGLSSGNKFELLRYYRKCLTKFSLVSNVGARILSIFYLVIMIIKKKSPTLFNKLIVKF